MGSGGSKKQNVKVKNLDNVRESCDTILNCKQYAVQSDEQEMLHMLFKDLCMRGSTSNLLEKRNFLFFIKLPVSSIQGALGEHLYDISVTESEECMSFSRFCSFLKRFCTDNTDLFLSNMFTACDFRNDKQIDRDELKVFVSII